jgi:hypothetical protein
MYIHITKLKNMKHPIKSIFEQISERVFIMKDLNEAKRFVTEFINERKINDRDKQNILREVNNAKTLARFQTYICNSLLKYEGMGVNQMSKTAKQAAAETAFE